MKIRLDNLEEDLNNWESEILNKGKIEGKIEGINETQKEIAKKLKEKLSIEEISEITGLSEEKIKEL